MSQIFERQRIQYQNLQQILNDTVKIAREILECDRVIIYNASDLPQAGVLAESVDQNCISILGQAIRDPFLAGDYLEMYCYGMSLTIDDIYSVETGEEELTELEKLGVRSVAVAPIHVNQKLLAFLVAHQCDQIQPWPDPTVDLLAEQASTLGEAIAKDNHHEELKDLTILQLRKILDPHRDSQHHRQVNNQLNTQHQQARNNMSDYTQISNGNQQKQLVNLPQYPQPEGLWIKHFADVLQQIRQSLKIKDILQASVREVQRILNCDRVLIYSLHQKVYGKILAESVSSGWTKAEGMVFRDPCFEARYFTKYLDGRVQALNNVYEAGLSQCYIEQLEQLEVKANLIVPIIIEGKLFGLLVAHQCSAPRQWQQAEILWLTQIAIQIGFTLDNAQLIADAHRLRQQVEVEKIWTGHFSDVVQQIRQSLKQENIVRAAVREVRRILNCDRVVIYALDQDNYGKIVAEAVVHGWTKAEGRIIKDPCFETRYLEQYRDGRVRAWENIYTAGMSQCYIEQLAKLEVKANLVTPIIHQGKLLGLLVAHQCSSIRQWQQAEIRWLTQIATQVGLALDNAQMLVKLEQYTKENQVIVERAIKNSSAVKQTVDSVTAEFANLNNSCEKFAQNIDQVKDLSKQLAQESMKMARSMNPGQLEDNNQNTGAVEQSDRIFALMQELFETTAKIDPLFTSIKTEITAKASIFATDTEQLMTGVDDFQTASQNLQQIVALNRELSNLISNISLALDTQIKGSTFTQSSVANLTNITQRISQQSLAMINSLSQLKLS